VKVEFTQGYVLHQTPYRDTSLLLDFFSEDYGRCRLIAKGARKTSKRKVNHFQLYQPLSVSWTTYGDLGTVTAAEPYKPAFSLKNNANLCGLYVNELLVRLLPLHEAEQSLFHIYETTLKSLANAEQIEVTLRLFEKHLLEQLGYGLNLTYEAEQGTAISSEKSYYYQQNVGLLVAYDGCPFPTISGRSIQKLVNGRGFDDDSLLEIKQLMREVIRHHLGGKPLNSRQLFAQMQHYAAQ
jgi:DNA repair protein RecO (recombination protein O)